MSFETVLRQSYMTFRCLKYTLKFLEANQWGSRSETLFFFLQTCGFAISGFGHQGNLRICDLQTHHYKFVNLRFATGTAQKFADLQLRNEPKNLPICDLTKKILQHQGHQESTSNKRDTSNSEEASTSRDTHICRVEKPATAGRQHVIYLNLVSLAFTSTISYVPEKICCSNILYV